MLHSCPGSQETISLTGAHAPGTQPFPGYIVDCVYSGFGLLADRCVLQLVYQYCCHHNAGFTDLIIQATNDEEFVFAPYLNYILKNSS